jgi:predicted TIM-barrel fold metal-dependent hydrolase
MKRDYFVVDMHSHVADSSTPNRIAERAGNKEGVRRAFEGIGRLQEDVGFTGGMLELNPSPDNFIRLMDASGTDVAILSMLGFTEELDGIEISSSDFLAGVIRDERYSGRYFGFAGVDPRLPDAAERLEDYIKNKGFIGAKLNPNDWGCFPLDAPMLEPIFAKCEELHVPLHIHTGTDPSGLIANANPLLLDAAANRHPELIILLEHYGFPFKHEAYAMCRKHENVYLTLAWHFNKLVHHNRLLAWSELEEMRIHAGLDKILYGSDYPATPNNKEVIEFLKYSGMPVLLRCSGVKDWNWEMRAKVLGLNAARLLKLNSPRLAQINASRRGQEKNSESGISMAWSDQAQATLEKIPPFIRQQAIRKIEKYARENGIGEVTQETMDKARKE